MPTGVGACRAAMDVDQQVVPKPSHVVPKAKKMPMPVKAGGVIKWFAPPSWGATGSAGREIKRIWLKAASGPVVKLTKRRNVDQGGGQGRGDVHQGSDSEEAWGKWR